MMQITKNMVSVLNLENYPVIPIEDYNDINFYLNDAEYLVVVTAGNIFLHRDKLWNKINNIDPKIGMLAHILQFENDDTPYLHEQFFIINTKAVDSADLDFQKSKSRGPKLARSKEDVHDDHAPLFVTLEEKTVDRQMKFGSNLIEQILKKGYEVRNFDEEWRVPQETNDHYLGIQNLPLRGFCYPKKNTKIFSKSLRELEIYPGLDESQNIFLELVKKGLEYQVLNVWHYDHVPTDVVEFDHIIVPATGFLGEEIAYKTGAKKITFYDINSNNLEFKKALYKNWSGKDYEKFYENWAHERNLTIEPNSGEDLKSSLANKTRTEQTLFPVWKQWKNTVEIEYIHDDLIGSQPILDAISHNSLIFTSTILGIYTFTSITHNEDNIEKTKQQISERVSATSSRWIEI